MKLLRKLLINLIQARMDALLVKTSYVTFEMSTASRALPLSSKNCEKVCLKRSAAAKNTTLSQTVTMGREPWNVVTTTRRMAAERKSIIQTVTTSALALTSAARAMWR